MEQKYAEKVTLSMILSGIGNQYLLRLDEQNLYRNSDLEKLAEDVALEKLLPWRFDDVVTISASDKDEIPVSDKIIGEFKGYYSSFKTNSSH